MRRLARHVSTILAAICLLPCVTVCVLWVRSYRTVDAVGFTRQRPAPASDLICSANGGIIYQHLAYPANSTARYSSAGWSYERGPYTAALAQLDGHRPLGVGYSDTTPKVDRYGLNGTREIVAQLPYWLLLAATGTLPIGGVLLRRHRRRAAREGAARGLCPTCGYDLRAHGEGERCPECGIEVNLPPDA